MSTKNDDQKSSYEGFIDAETGKSPSFSLSLFYLNLRLMFRLLLLFWIAFQCSLPEMEMFRRCF